VCLYCDCWDPIPLCCVLCVVLPLQALLPSGECSQQQLRWLHQSSQVRLMTFCMRIQSIWSKHKDKALKMQSDAAAVEVHGLSMQCSSRPNQLDYHEADLWPPL
jgi:hypothetical protein